MRCPEPRSPAGGGFAALRTIEESVGRAIDEWSDEFFLRHFATQSGYLALLVEGIPGLDDFPALTRHRRSFWEDWTETYRSNSQAASTLGEQLERELVVPEGSSHWGLTASDLWQLFVFCNVGRALLLSRVARYRDGVGLGPETASDEMSMTRFVVSLGVLAYRMYIAHPSSRLTESVAKCLQALPH